MIFSRTVSGLKNLHKFHGVEVIVYVEGENNESKFDKKFYEKIFIECSDYKEVKIKPIGNCTHVLEMYEKICFDGNNNSICFLDRDYNGLKYSYINDERLKFTYGYSWENDFWSDKLIVDTIDLLSGSEINKIDFNLSEFINNTKKNAYKISCLDCVSQIYQISILNKRSATFGINILRDARLNSLISRREQLRIKRKAPVLKIIECSISKNVYRNTLKAEHCKIIQGHFWEILAINIVKTCLSSLNSNTSLPFEYIKNIARSLFLKNFDRYFEPKVKNYYLSQLS